MTAAPPLVDALLQRRDEIALAAERLGIGAQRREAAAPLGGGHLVALDRDDLRKDVAHDASIAPCAKAMNSSSLARAAPLRSASRAKTTPSAMSAETFAA